MQLQFTKHNELVNQLINSQQSINTRIRVLLLDKDEKNYRVIENLLTTLPNNLFELKYICPEPTDCEFQQIVFQHYHICLVDAHLWIDKNTEQAQKLSILQQHLSPLVSKASPNPVILLTENPQLGMAALDLGIEDYWDKNELNSSMVERSLRLIFKNAKNLQQLKINCAELQEWKNSYEAAIEASGQIFYNWNSETNQVIWSGNIEKNLGYGSEEIIDNLEWWNHLIHPEDKIKLAVEIELINKTQKNARLEYRVRRKDGVYILIEEQRKFFIDCQSQQVQMVGLLKDITERKRPEETIQKYEQDLKDLREKEKQLRVLMDSLPVCIAYTDAEQRYQFINKNYENWFGKKKEDILGKTLQEVIGKHAYQVVRLNIERVLKGESVTYETTLLYQHGGTRHVLGNLIPDIGEDNQVKGYYAVITDISERKRAEEQLRYRLVLETAITLVSKELASYEQVDFQRVLQILGVAVNANRVYLLRFYNGATKASMIHEWCDYNTQPKIEHFQNRDLLDSPWWIKHLIQNKGIIHASIDSLLACTKQDQNLSSSDNVSSGMAIPIYNHFGKLWGQIGFDSLNNQQKIWAEEDGQLLRVVGDIIYRYYERIIAQEKLQASESLYASIFNHSTDAIFLVKILPNGEFVYETVNAAYEKATGFSLEQIVGKTPRDLFPPHIAIEIEQRYQTCLKTRETLSYEKTLELPIGKRIWRTNLVPIADAQNKIFTIQGSARDITEERKAIDEQIHHAKFHQLLASLTIKIRQSWQIEEILQTAVREIQTTLNLDRVMFLKFTSKRTAKVIHESVADGFASFLNKVYPNNCLINPSPTEYDQGQIQGDLSLASIECQACYQEVLQQISIQCETSSTPQCYLNFPIIIDQSSQESSTPVLWGLLFIQQYSHPHQWTADEIDIFRQIADQLSIALKQAQLKQQELAQKEELTRSNQDLEQFAYIVSHDLQEPLGIIASYGQLLKRQCQGQLDPKSEKYIEQMLKSVRRMRQQIEDLLQYSRVGTQKPTFQLIDCNWILRQAIANLEIPIKKHQATIHISTPLPTLMADSSQLLQLWQNLISNAIKYHQDLPPFIEIYCQRRGQEWLFSVCDNGIGIEPKYSERIFQVFQRLHTQEEYPGTGIGLALCQRIVQRYGGRIWVESELGKGSTFFFTIPEYNRVL